MERKERGKYDKVMRGNLVSPGKGLIGRLLSFEIVEVNPLPPRIRQTIGEENISMKNYLAFSGNYYSYKIVDIREFEPELFLSSDNSKEIILAILAKYTEEQNELLVNKIINKLREINTSWSEFEESIRKLEIISNLRSDRIQEIIDNKIKTMPIIYDIRRDLRFKQGKAEGSLGCKRP